MYQIGLTDGLEMVVRTTYCEIIRTDTLAVQYSGTYEACLKWMSDRGINTAFKPNQQAHIGK